MPSFSPVAAANTIIQRYAGPSGVEHMKLHKILFYSYGWWLALKSTEPPLLTVKPEVWRYGPVFSPVYNVFARYGANNITEPYGGGPFSPAPPTVPEEEGQVIRFLNWIWDRYGHFDSFKLSDMTHAPGTPWQVMASRYNYKVPQHLEIEDEVTQTYFIGLARAEGLV
jgi:uncharacterized phage-associated protein